MKSSPLRSQAIVLMQNLEQERAGQTLMLGKVVKTLPTASIILSSSPELQAEFVQCVVDTLAKLGTPKGKKMTEWFRKKNVPSASQEVVRLLLRRSLPLTETSLAEMLNKLSCVSYLSLAGINEHLARALASHVKAHGASPGLRKAAKRFADVLAVRHLSPTEAAYWKDEHGFPRACDRKIAASIDQTLRR